MYILLFVAFLIVCSALFIWLAPQFGRPPFGEHLQKIKQSPHYNKTSFDNTPVTVIEMSLAEGFKLLGEMFFGVTGLRPKQKLPSQHPEFSTVRDAYLTWFGHSTFLYEIDGKKILFDPMLGKYASPIPGFIARYPYDLPVTAADMPPLDVVIISHDHYDHLDYGTIKYSKTK